MPTHTDLFTSSLSPQEVIDQFAALSADKGWKIKDRDDHLVDAQTGVSLKTWGEHIEVTADGTPEGTRVHLRVDTRFGLVDWGEGSAIQREVRTRLGGDQ